MFDQRQSPARCLQSYIKGSSHDKLSVHNAHFSVLIRIISSVFLLVYTTTYAYVFKPIDIPVPAGSSRSGIVLCYILFLKLLFTPGWFVCVCVCPQPTVRFSVHMYDCCLLWLLRITIVEKLILLTALFSVSAGFTIVP